jgi:hypothetical protein
MKIPHACSIVGYVACTIAQLVRVYNLYADGLGEVMDLDLVSLRGYAVKNYIYIIGPTTHFVWLRISQR